MVSANWVNLNLKCPITYPLLKQYITSLKDLFDPEGGIRPTLVDNNMTNKTMGPDSN